MKTAVLALGLALVARAAAGADDYWAAPADAMGRTNPLEVTGETLEKGAGLYARHCALCHGDKGEGDGPAAPFNPKKPRSLADAAWQKRATDGELLWKISSGRREGDHVLMPSFAEKLPAEEDRWSLVAFVRTLAPRPRARKKP